MIDWQLVVDSFPMIFRAMFMTLGITIGAYLVSVTFGLVLTLLGRSSFKPLAWLVYGFVQFVRSTPPLVQLFFVYYAWPQIPVIGVSMSPITAGIATLGIHYATYLSEIYRSGINAVPKGQWEASRALNFSRTKTWIKVILPQAIPPVIPMMGNYLIVLFKETPLLMAISVYEMLAAAREIGASSFQYTEVYTIVGLLFLLLSYPSSLLVGYAEKRMNNRISRKAKKVEKEQATT
ncbi:ectoine/hydroxyectoine ABC transporter permease subunit EhuD [Alkalicoccobacillus porphyridii]|uniref:Ectoine/hydroxyectoine ABC transporter permease subunit EhuD n=1 Tax=Alkalicoccobacillus porphyridii TaxID=2597270 RepID=A0A553ZUE6_9BACI|nr:ectoine/hydroxyectoine ABC transporter permease subunit EhuD [Alkalicoccobacillus porphyridii]TSB45043.1 ectoine/hydroxyectoine ABC transporter permease subunit EhuD [Alkalicoccobacillus porphyridii]